ncbi:hypothetical protein CC79DRAFT_1337891 [Sarocladium strictum]
MAQNKHRPARQNPLADEHRPSPAELVDRLKRSKNATVRKNAIRLLGKYLRRGDRFNATWEALGRAPGIATLLSELSVADVRALCLQLGRTASAVNARAERRAGLAELVTILMSGETDKRPLRRFYRFIVPGTHDEFVQSWEATPGEWTTAEKACLLHGHRELCEQRFLNDIFPKSPKQSCGFRDNVEIFHGHSVFCERILNHLLSIESGQVDIPKDFMMEFAMPLLKRIAKHRRSSTVINDKFLRLIVLCVKQHPESFKSQLSLPRRMYEIYPSNVLSFAVHRWADVPGAEDRELLRGYLKVLLGAMSANVNLHDVDNVLSMGRYHHPLHAQVQYELLLLIFNNVGNLRVDLESDSLAPLLRLHDESAASYSWPAELFLFLPVEKSIVLFDRLERLYQTRDFLYCRNANKTILGRECAIETHRKTNVDILRTMLQRKKNPGGSEWLDDVHLLVGEWMKRATEAREPTQRLAWAKVAVNLCVAAGDLNKVNDIFTWAQRFIKDPLVGPDLYGITTTTQELDTLLTAVPIPVPFQTVEQLEESISTAKSQIVIADKVIITLLQAAKAAVREPGFKAHRWRQILQLPAKIAEERIKASESIRRLASEINAPDQEQIIADAILKPTMTMLLDVEALMSDPAASNLVGGRGIFSAGLYMQNIPTRNPKIQAETLRFFMEAQKAKLPPSLVESQIWLVVSAVSKLAHSSEPSLAIPFIVPIIQNSQDSSSHRQLLTNGFLESLPTREASQFLSGLTQAMTEKMRQQNSRPWKDSEANRRPVIKVTTIKMLADLLNGSLVVDANTACEILVSLLREARHIDARIAIVTSLLTTLEESTSSPALRKQTLDVFEESVLPMASQLNERRPTTEEEWQGMEMPEVSEQSTLLALLVSRVHSKALREEDRTRLLHIIMRALEQSAVENQRWMELFADKNGFELRPNDNLSVGPAHPGPFETILRLEFDSVTARLFALSQNMILQNVDPVPGISHITASVKADAKLRASNAGKHWLSQFDNGGVKVFSFGLSAFVDQIQHGDASPHRIDQLRRSVVMIAERWMRQGQPDLVYNLADALVFQPRVQDTSTVDRRGRCISVLQDVIQVAVVIREEGTYSGPLPDIFRLRISILKLKHWNPSQVPSEFQIVSFEETVSNLVDELASRRRPYHNDFARLKAQLTQQAQSDPEFARVSIALMSLDESVLTEEEPSLGAYLRFELIADGLRAANVPKKREVRDGVLAGIGRWTACPAEELRAMGQQLEKDLRKKKGYFAGE